MLQRIQRQRTKGWRTPLCTCGCGKPAIYVGRPTKWGNPKRPGDTFDWWVMGKTLTSTIQDAAEAVDYYTLWLTDHHPDDIPPGPAGDLTSLTGHDLMCWCPLDQPCHADVLLELANGGAPA